MNGYFSLSPPLVLSFASSPYLCFQDIQGIHQEKDLLFLFSEGILFIYKKVNSLFLN